MLVEMLEVGEIIVEVEMVVVEEIVVVLEEMVGVVELVVVSLGTKNRQRISMGGLQQLVCMTSQET